MFALMPIISSMSSRIMPLLNARIQSQRAKDVQVLVGKSNEGEAIGHASRMTYWAARYQKQLHASNRYMRNASASVDEPGDRSHPEHDGATDTCHNTP